MSNVELAVALSKKSQLQSNEEAAEIAAALGLDVQARRYAKQMASEVFKPMTRDEELVWRFVAPTIYFEKAVEGRNRRLLSDYAFDSIPVEVLRHWQQVREQYCFDSYEVWTTERARANVEDPLLVGILGQAHYILARWANEAPDILPFRKLVEQTHQTILEQAVEGTDDSCGGFTQLIHGREERRRRRASRAVKDLLSWENWNDRHQAFAAARRILGYT